MSVFKKLESTIIGGAIIIGAAQIASRILGLFRERMLASTFGAGNVLDVYYAAFKIPDFVFNIVVLGALSSAFVPVFLEYIHKDKLNGGSSKESYQVANSILNIILIGVIVLGVIVMLFARQLMPLIAVGFSAEKQDQVVALVRVMYLSVVFFSISNVISGILHSYRRFLAFSLAPIMYNAGIIFGIKFLVPRFGTVGLAYGVVLGAVMHLLVQLPSAYRAGFRYRMFINFTLSGVRKIGRLMIPRAIGLGITQIDQIISTTIASTLAVGSVAVFNLANNLQYFPISVFGVSLALSAFPVFSQAFTEKDTNKFILHFSKTFRRIIFFILPASIMILLLRAQIVRLVLGAGNFDWEDTILTAQTLGFLSLSLFAQSLIPLLARAFYSFQNTKTPVIIGIVSVFLNIVGSLTLGRIMGVQGLALSFSISSLVNMILLIAALRVRIGELDDRKIINSTLKIAFLSLLMGLIVQGVKYLIAPHVDMHTFFGILIQTAASALGGGLFYVLFAILFRFDEVENLGALLNKVKNLIFNPNKKVNENSANDTDLK